MSNPFDLTGNTALVTGANTGIGQGIAVALAAAGADIAAAGRSAPFETQKAVEAPGGIDILVNNAGIIRRADSIAFSEDDWDAVMNTNLKTVFFLAQAVAKVMLASGGGKVINIASLLSFQGGIRVPSYTASKSAMAGLMKILANEWAAKGINVNAYDVLYSNLEATRT